MASTLGPSSDALHPSSDRNKNMIKQLAKAPLGTDNCRAKFWQELVDGLVQVNQALLTEHEEANHHKRLPDIVNHGSTVSSEIVTTALVAKTRLRIESEECLRKHGLLRSQICMAMCLKMDHQSLLPGIKRRDERRK